MLTDMTMAAARQPTATRWTTDVRVRGIGIAVAGMVDTQTGEIVRSDHAPGFNGLAVGLLASVACGIVGSYVVARRISYLAGSVSHSVLGGLGAPGRA